MTTVQMRSKVSVRVDGWRGGAYLLQAMDEKSIDEELEAVIKALPAKVQIEGRLVQLSPSGDVERVVIDWCDYAENEDKLKRGQAKPKKRAAPVVSSDGEED